eukprot:gene18186-28021_t
MPPKSATKKKTTGKSVAPKKVEKKRSLGSKAGLVFPAARIAKRVRDARVASRLSQQAVITLTAVVQAACHELLLASAKAAAINKKKTVKPRHIKLAVCEDEDFGILLRDVTIAQGGVRPMEVRKPVIAGAAK